MQITLNPALLRLAPHLSPSDLPRCRFSHMCPRHNSLTNPNCPPTRRDLKPGNLLVTRSCELRITDFGLARARPVGKGANPDELIEEPMTEHVVRT